MNPRYVDPESNGIRLEDYLAREWPQTDRAALRAAIAREEVWVNGLPANARQRLRPDDVVTVRAAAGDLPKFRPPQPDDLQIPILHEDDRILVVDKPPGEPSVPDRGGKYLGVFGRVCALRPDEDLRVVHRLDQYTSGCLMFAKGLETARAIDAAFRARTVHKEYAALVEGVVSAQRLELDKPLGPDPSRPGKITVVRPGSRGARTAHTSAEVEERFRRHTLLRVVPQTGRSHQIRVHLRHRGHPIVADRDYGTRRKLLLSEIKSGYKLRRGVVERPLLDRMFLHAGSIALELPGDHAVSVRAPLPADLQRVLDKMRRFAVAGRTGGCV